MAAENDGNITSGLSERSLVRVRVRNMVRTRVRVRAVPGRGSVLSGPNCVPLR